MKRLIINSSKKRSFKEIRKAILKSLNRPKTITETSREVKTSWVTARRHLQWLVILGKVKVKERLGRKFYFKVLK